MKTHENSRKLAKTRENSRYDFLGTRYALDFLGTRYAYDFLGTRYASHFLGTRYASHFLGTRYALRFGFSRHPLRFGFSRHPLRFGFSGHPLRFRFKLASCARACTCEVSFRLHMPPQSKPLERCGALRRRAARGLFTLKII